MFTVSPFMRSRSLLRPTSRKPRPPMGVEGLEGRVMFAFNA